MKSRNLLTGLFLSVMVSSAFIACDKDDDNAPPSLRSKEYTLTPFNGSGVTGKVRINENADRSFNVTVALDKSVKDTVHIAKIYAGSIDNPGEAVIPLTNITGNDSAVSVTTSNINTITYDSLMNYNGFVRVNYSAYKSDSIVAQANIGKSNQ